MTEPHLADEDTLRRFEDAWRSGRPAALEEFLPPADHPAHLETLAALAGLEMRLAWEGWKRSAGGAARPSPPRSVESYLQRFPHLDRPPLVLRLIQQEYLARHSNDDHPSPAEYLGRFPGLALREQDVRGLLSTVGNEPAVARLPAAVAGPTVPTPEAVILEKSGRYRILRKLGAGGMGVVYLADDTELDRRVALKVPRSFGDEGPEAVQRFQREARAAAGLAHPNICPVFDIGQVEGVHYLTMRFVEGRSLAEVLREGPPPAPADAVALVRKVALAMAYAHGRGVTHRDLKPANIMLEGPGEPVVMDFGLARRSAPADVRLTHDGAVLGTPAYMSPEQVRGDVQALGPATDVYSLGVILYELLTGRLPFQGPSGHVREQILHASPPPPSALVPGLDRRLDAVCLRAMARDPADRYPSMQALAEALGPVGGALSADDTVREAPPGRPRGRPWKPARVAAALAGLVVLALLTVAVYGRRGERQAGAEDSRPAVPAADAGPNAQPGPAAVPARSGPVVLKESRRFEGHTGAVASVACGGGEHPAVSTSQEDRTFRVWDVTTGKEFEANRGQFVGGRTSFNADGRRYTYEDGFWVKVVDTGSGKEVRGVELAVLSLLGNHALSANGKWLAVSVYYGGEPNPGPYALAVNVETGSKYWFRGHKGQEKPEAVMVAPDGKSGASAGADGLYLWDLAEPDSVKERRRIDRDAVISLAFAPDGESLLAGEKVDALILWDARTGARRARFDGHIGPVNCVAFSPDGKWALSGGADRTARLWDVRTGKELARLQGHDGEVTCVAFAGQDRRALTGSTDKTVRLWDLAALAEAGPEK